MQARYIRFGEVEIDGLRYTEDIVIENGRVRDRDKAVSRPQKRDYGHTPLSEHESIPWNCSRLIVGTGANGRLPITAAVHTLARDHGVELVAVPTDKACALLTDSDLASTNAILHLTC